MGRVAGGGMVRILPGAEPMGGDAEKPAVKISTRALQKIMIFGMVRDG